jgi:hypothetical protein
MIGLVLCRLGLLMFGLVLCSL